MVIVRGSDLDQLDLAVRDLDLELISRIERVQVGLVDQDGAIGLDPSNEAGLAATAGCDRGSRGGGGTGHFGLRKEIGGLFDELGVQIADHRRRRYRSNLLCPLCQNIGAEKLSISYSDTFSNVIHIGGPPKERVVDHREGQAVLFEGQVEHRGIETVDQVGAGGIAMPLLVWS